MLPAKWCWNSLANLHLIIYKGGVKAPFFWIEILLEPFAPELIHALLQLLLGRGGLCVP